MPATFEYRCPGDTQAYPGDRQHWGTVCYRHPMCPDGPYIAINVGAVGPSDARLRYAVAHETCHAIDWVAGGPVEEQAADACAAAHGFPRV